MVREEDRCKLKCKYCGEIFESRSPNRKTCYEKECRLRLLRDRNIKIDVSRKKYAESHKGKQASARLPYYRRYRRKSLQKLWGDTGRLVWHESESIDLIELILKNEGFSNVINLNSYFKHFVFDYYAEKNGERYVFQITTRTHTNKTKQHYLSELFGMRHLTIFIKHDLKHYVVKEGANPELAINDIKNIKEVTI